MAVVNLCATCAQTTRGFAHTNSAAQLAAIAGVAVVVVAVLCAFVRQL